jgi:hypothetical protein
MNTISENGVYQTQFCEEVAVKLWKMQERWRNGESSVLFNLLSHCTHQIFTNHRRSAAPRIVMHIFASFNKVSHPSPYHWITHGKFSTHLTKLRMNVSQFHVSCIQVTDYRPHFICGGLLHFLEHSKHTVRCVNAVCLQMASVHSIRTNELCMHVHHSDHRTAASICANETYFVDTPRTVSPFRWISVEAVDVIMKKAKIEALQTYTLLMLYVMIGLRVQEVGSLGFACNVLWVCIYIHTHIHIIALSHFCLFAVCRRLFYLQSLGNS